MGRQSVGKESGEIEIENEVEARGQGGGVDDSLESFFRKPAIDGDSDPNAEGDEGKKNKAGDKRIVGDDGVLDEER